MISQRKAWRRELVSIAGRWHQMRPFARSVTLEMFEARRRVVANMSRYLWSGGAGPDPLLGVAIPRILRPYIRPVWA